MSGAVTDLAGALTQRVVLQRRGADRDDLGGADGEWAVLATVWAAIAPAPPATWGQGDRPAAARRWQAVLRVTDVAIGDRLAWRGLLLGVRSIEADPGSPDRLSLLTEEDS